MNYVNAGEAKKILQISYMTLKRWKDKGVIKCKKLTDRKVLYDIDSVNEDLIEKQQRKNVIYARVSTTKQKADLDHQIELIKSYMLVNGIKADEVYAEIGSGLNDQRQALSKLIIDVSNDEIGKIYISFKDRLTRFGYNYFVTFCHAHNTEIFVLDEHEDTNKDFQQELTEDLISIIHHFSTKLYSNRRKKIKEIERIIKDEEI